ncbi:uncharacterized protein ACR2FA_007248 [Aphomia sociella]
MSLLEDVFLEDEAGEAQELERVIEGDEYDDRPQSINRDDSDSNSEKEDEAVEDKRRVDPTQTKAKKVIKNPRFILNPARLTGPRGIHVIPDHFKDFKFKGKGHEKEDLDMVLKKMEHWAYRLYPKFEFQDCLKKIEMLGKKRPVMVHLHKIRSDQYTTEETVVQKDSSDEDIPTAPEEDEFDKLLQQQIELARATPAPDSVKKPAFSTPKVDNRSPLTMPKAISSPSITNEQKERMLQNRRLAEERRLARLKNIGNNQNDNTVINTQSIIVEDYINESTAKNSEPSIINEEPIVVENYAVNDRINEVDLEEHRKKKHNRSNVIDSSDEECEEVVFNQSITVDVHNNKPDIEMTNECSVNINDEKNCTEVNDDIEMQNDENNTGPHNDIENSNDALLSHDENVEDNIKETNGTDISDKDLNDSEGISINKVVPVNSLNPVSCSDTEKNNETIIDKDNIVVNSDGENESDSNDIGKSKTDDIHSNITKLNDNHDNTQQDINQCNETYNGNDKSIGSNKETIQNNDAGNLMDVDFSEEF